VAKPIIKKLSAASFLDGSVVYENDARIGGEIAGNVEISDLSEPRSRYNITVGPVYYGPDSTVVTAGTSSWYSPTVSALVFIAPRDMTVLKIEAFHYSDGGSYDNVDDDNKLLVIAETAARADGVSGAYKETRSVTLEPLVPVSPWVHLGYASVDDTESTGVYTSSDISKSVSEGDVIRVVLTAAGNTSKTQAEVVVTLMVAEDHAE